MVRYLRMKEEDVAGRKRLWCWAVAEEARHTGEESFWKPGVRVDESGVHGEERMAIKIIKVEGGHGAERDVERVVFDRPATRSHHRGGWRMEKPYAWGRQGESELTAKIKREMNSVMHVRLKTRAKMSFCNFVLLCNPIAIRTTLSF